jgi:site-specific recombinase XerC
MRVVHCKHEKYTQFIGRGSIYGNPFTHLPLLRTQAVVQVQTLDESVDFYEGWLRGDPRWAQIDPRRRLRILAALTHNAFKETVDESTLAILLAGITNARDKVLVALFLSSGLRLSELHQLNRETIEVDQTEEGDETRILGTGEVIGKRRKKRRFYIDAETVNALVEYLGSREDDAPSKVGS